MIVPIWGGRYTLRTPARAELDLDGFNGGVPVPLEARPIRTNAIDKVTPDAPAAYGPSIKPGARRYMCFRETLWRWPDDFRNDFVARIGWTYLTPAEGNHPPVVTVPHGERRSVRSGGYVQSSALG